MDFAGADRVAAGERIVIRIVLEALAVTMGRDAARALRAAGLDEALRLPRPWDQQWSLHIPSRYMAYETDLFEYPSTCSRAQKVMDEVSVQACGRGVPAEMAIVAERGGRWRPCPT